MDVVNSLCSFIGSAYTLPLHIPSTASPTYHAHRMRLSACTYIPGTVTPFQIGNQNSNRHSISKVGLRFQMSTRFQIGTRFQRPRFQIGHRFQIGTRFQSGTRFQIGTRFQMGTRFQVGHQAIDIIANGTGWETDDVMRPTSVTGVRFLDSV